LRAADEGRDRMAEKVQTHALCAVFRLSCLGSIVPFKELGEIKLRKRGGVN